MTTKPRLLTMPFLAVAMGVLCSPSTTTRAHEATSMLVATCDSLPSSPYDPAGQESAVTTLVLHAKNQMSHSMSDARGFSTGSGTTTVGDDTVTATAWVFAHSVLADSIAVVLAWTEQITDANAAGIVFGRRICFGGIRSLGILDLKDTSAALLPADRALADSFFDAPRLQWNAALGDFGARQIVSDDRAALKLTDLFLNFAIGEMPLDLPRSAGGPMVTLKQLPGISAKVFILSSLTTERRDQVWTVGGILDMSARYRITVEIDRFGLVRSWNILRQY
jgi:hypothetical protein